jgi:hypothetical protein
LLTDEWKYTFDNDFAKNLFKTSTWNEPLQQLVSCQCCVACEDMLHFGDRVSLPKLRGNANDCQLCEPLLHKIGQCYKNDQQEIDIVRRGSALQIKDGPRILRLCSGLGASDDNRDDDDDDSDNIQPGLPVLP